jgi:lipopolysaccharide/colanic/teichoic acid biosynthesis glycosyltransferase
MRRVAEPTIAVARTLIAKPAARPATLSPLHRAVEVVVATVLFAATLPLMILVWLLIRLTSKGNPIFVQTRLGRDAKPFRFVKFRTMYVDARKRHPELYAYQYSNQDLRDLKFKIAHDPRVTAIGQYLRASTLDELPNFWNVITGEMALVGPRPEIPEMLPYYEGAMLEKFSVAPGVTGLAQIRGRGRLGFYETVELDVEYARTRNGWLDVQIFFLTIWKIVTRDGAF